MRDIFAVIEGVKKLIPQDDNGMLFRSSLDKLTESALYTAPEAMGHQWDSFSIIVGRFIPIPIEEWQYQVVFLFCDINDDAERNSLRKKWKAQSNGAQ